MELRQLRAFLEVSSQLHFGRAAARLNLTQPALTQRIQALERELGVQLLERNARGVMLTSAGELLLPYARSLVQVEESALRNLKQYAAGSAGRIRIAHLTAADTAMPGRIVAEFRRRHTAVDVETSSAATPINLDRMVRGEVDAAFVTMMGPIPPGISVRWLSRIQLVLALPSRHRLARLERIPVSALAGEQFIMVPPEAMPTLVAALEQWLKRHVGGNLNVAAYEMPEQAVEAIAESDSLITLVNGGRAQITAIPGITFRPLSPSPQLHFGIAHVRDDPSPIVANLLEIAGELARTEPRDPARDGEFVLAAPD